jgi:hypothetical protein
MKPHLWSLLLGLLVCLPACRDKHTTAFPVGEWYARDDQKGLFSRLNFRENGRFDGFVDYQSKRAATFEGAWQFRDSIVYYTYAKCEPVMLFKDGKDQDTIVEITDTYYTFKTTKGELHRYDRFRSGQPTPENQPK